MVARTDTQGQMNERGDDRLPPGAYLEATPDPIRNDWSLAEVQALFALPFMDLILKAQRVHRAYHVPNAVQMSTLLSIKTGACPEDCAYCRRACATTRVSSPKRSCRSLQSASVPRGLRPRSHALLHGRRLPRPQGARPRGSWR